MKKLNDAEFLAGECPQSKPTEINCPTLRGTNPEGAEGAHTCRNNTGRIHGQYKRSEKRGKEIPASQHESFRA